MRHTAPALVLLFLLSATAPPMVADADEAIDEQAVLEDLQQRDPATYEQLMQFKEQSEQLYEARLRRVHGKMVLRATHPEWFEAEAKVAEVEAQINRKIGAYHAAPPEERETREEELLELAGDAADYRLDMYRLRIALLKLRLEDLEAQVRTREHDRDAFVRSWLDRKLGGSP